MKNVWVGIGIAAVIILAGIVYWVTAVPPVSAAVLYIENGTVSVDTGHGWVNGNDEMELPVGAKVRTGPEGTAAVVLLEGEIVHLEPETEITIDTLTDSNIHISQAYGETWNKVTKISGISTFEVETPSTVATVRGTEFFVTTNADEDDVAVIEGDVDVSPVNDKEYVQNVKPNEQMRFNKKTKQMVMKDLKGDTRVAKFQAKYIKHLQHMRAQELRKNKHLIGLAKKQYTITDKDIAQHMQELDTGAKDADKEFQQVPKMLQKKVERAYKITKAIQKAKANQR